MSRLLWIVPALAACHPDPDPGAALDRLVSQVLEPSGVSEDEVVVHQVGHVAPGDDLVAAWGDPVGVEAPSTLFLVDRHAGAGWSHDVDWVFLADDGDASVRTLGSFPVVDGEPFVREWEPSVWGAPWDPYDPEDVDEDEELTLWDGATGAPRAASDPCDPPKPRVAVTIAGAQFRAVRTDARNWQRLLAGRGYETISVGPRGRRPPTRDAVLGAIRQAVAEGPLEELVIVYAGHGVERGGAWGLGDTVENLTGFVTEADLIRELRSAEVDRLTIVALSCHSGQLRDLPRALKDAGLTATDLVVHAASGNEAWIPRDNAGSAYGRALYDAVAHTLPGEDIAWEGVAVGPLTTVTSVGPRTQTPERAVQERCEPEIGLATYPAEGGCFAAWLDMTDTADSDPSQDYGREAMLRGRGFGAATGALELQQEGGAWVRVPHRFWGPEGIAFNLPMRRDGFPSTGTAPDVPDALEAPADRRGLPGTYLVRVVTAEGRVSPPQPVHVVAQVYDQVWTPYVVAGDFPDWVEQWHPLTPEALWTNGPTIQLSSTYDGTRAPAIDSALDFDQDQPHQTTLPPVGSWFYELPPALRDLSSAYDQRGPEFQYWGYRARFPDDAVAPIPWGFVLIYD